VAHLKETWDKLVGTERRFGVVLEERNLICGSPDDVAGRIAQLRDAGIRNVLFSMTPSGLPPEKVAQSMRLFAERVAPRFRNS
jgi:alkanesulfonate monooxygenase SsuD/methylene tetrahydromethanopterin reductase-like flavin-dependent oxidoreductase (luciferase family)